MAKFSIGNKVVRSIGDYVVGRIGTIIAFNESGIRAQVDWEGNTKTWVSVNSIELESVPYEIVTNKRLRGYRDGVAIYHTTWKYVQVGNLASEVSKPIIESKIADTVKIAKDKKDLQVFVYEIYDKDRKYLKNKTVKAESRKIADMKAETYCRERGYFHKYLE